MHDELTESDIQKMKEEIEYRTLTMRPKLIEEVKRTREFGDLSENFEYKEAKKAKNRNDSRIRYLNNMIRTARIVEDTSDSDSVGINDLVKCYMPDMDMTMDIRIVTTVRNDAANGFISKKSPLGEALFGRRKGECVTVSSPDGNYEVRIDDIVKSDGSDIGNINEY